MQKQKLPQLWIMGPQSYLGESSICHTYKAENKKVILTNLSKNWSVHSRIEEF